MTWIFGIGTYVQTVSPKTFGRTKLEGDQCNSSSMNDGEDVRIGFANGKNSGTRLPKMCAEATKTLIAIAEGNLTHEHTIFPVLAAAAVPPEHQQQGSTQAQIHGAAGFGWL